MMESGPEAALLLGDKKRQDLFKKDVSKHSYDPSSGFGCMHGRTFCFL